MELQLDIPDTPPGWAEIVGVVSDVKTFSEGPQIDPEVYEPFLQRPVAGFSLVLRTNVEPNSLMPDLRRAVASIDSELPLLNVMSMDGVFDTQRKGNTLFSRFAGGVCIARSHPWHPSASMGSFRIPWANARMRSAFGWPWERTPRTSRG